MSQPRVRMPQLKILHAAIKTCSQINKLIKKKRYHSILLLLLSCVRLFCDPMDHSPPGSSVHGIFQARILEWVAIDFPSIYNSMLLSWKSVIPFWFLWVHYKKKKKGIYICRKRPEGGKPNWQVTWVWILIFPQVHWNSPLPNVRGVPARRAAEKPFWEILLCLGIYQKTLEWLTGCSASSIPENLEWNW